VKLGKPTLIYSIFSFLNTLVAFIRDIFLAAFLGTGVLADIFLVALRIPLSFKRSISDETFNSAYIPIFNKLDTSENARLKYDFARKILLIFFLLFLSIVILAELFMPSVIKIFARGLNDIQEFDLLVKTSRVLFPYLLFIALSSVLIGTLNAKNRFILSAILPAILHTSIIIAISISILFDASKLSLLSTAVLIGGLLQTLLLFFSVEKLFWANLFKFKDNYTHVRNFFRLVWPSFLSSFLLQFNIIIGLIFASLELGAVSYLYYAERVYLLPLVLITIPITRVMIPNLTNCLRSGSLIEARDIQTSSIKYLTVLVFPAAFCLFFLSDAFIEVFFQRGEFSELSTNEASLALKYFLLGLPSASYIRVLTPYFFAKDQPYTPLKLALIASFLCLCLIFFLNPTFGFLSIPISISISSWLHLYLYFREHKKINFFIFDIELLGFLTKYLFLSAFLYLLLYLSDLLLIDYVLSVRLLLQVILVLTIWFTYIYYLDSDSRKFFIKWF